VTAPKGGGSSSRSNGRVAAGSVLAERYRLEERVAAGGMGEVWRATDLLLQRTVAVKLLREALAEDPIVVERFRREALLAAQISHPNMAGVYDYVHDGGRTGIVMEYVDGETLAERLAREGKLSVAESIRVGSGILTALRSAHDSGIVHRDVKPGNVMITPAGDVKVTDFGIARAVSDHTLTETGAVIGTAHYLSPEQVAGKAATPSSDVYSVGAVMYEMLAGQKPFTGETQIAVAMKRLTEDPPPIGSVRKDVPASVARVIDHALERDPTVRFSTADQMRLALDEAAGTSTPATMPNVMDPTPTEVLPVADARASEAEAASLAETTVRPAVVAERRKREYKRLVGYLALFAVGIGLLTFVILALAGGGSDVVKVPDFRGQMFDGAKARAEALGFTVHRVDRDSTRDAGIVANQDIRVGTRLVRDGDPIEITLYVSTGTPPPTASIQVPDVQGLTREDAERTLREAGFNDITVTLQASNEEPGTVIGQDPAGGEMARRDQEVDIVVATAPRKHGKGRGGD
jgi:eukaryotic-like serine/threonine-protein kinase